MRFMGSAMRSPHIQGGFRDRLVCSAAQAYKIPDDLSFGEAALAEPTAVCLHALSRAGDLVGKRVLITGAGPIGLLMVAVCRLAGAKYIVATDRLDRPLQMAMKMGADATINVSESEGHLGASAERDSLFEVLFEASGNPQALLDGISALGPRGIGVLIGQGAEVPLQVSKVIGRELDLRGSFRFDREFGSAIGYLASGRLRVANLITATLPASEAVSAFDLALDKTVSVKVQLAFT
jgi:L-idonate 5-dehydrogenase